MRNELSRPESSLIVRHLLTGCSLCRQVTRPLWNLGEPAPAGPASRLKEQR